jgi:hypothetical protein
MVSIITEVGQLISKFNSASKVTPLVQITSLYLKQEGHDGPEVAHLYIGHQSAPGLLFEQTW